MGMEKMVKITEQDLKQAKPEHKFSIQTIFRNCRDDHFSMAVAHLLSIGWQAAQQISDKDLEKMSDNSFMNAGTQKNICEWARMIAWNCTPVELICFCEYQGIYDPAPHFKDIKVKTLEKAIKIMKNCNIDYDCDFDVDQLYDAAEIIKKEEVDA